MSAAETPVPYEAEWGTHQDESRHRRLLLLLFAPDSETEREPDHAVA